MFVALTIIGFCAAAWLGIWGSGERTKRLEAQRDSEDLEEKLANTIKEHENALATVQETAAQNLQDAEARWKQDKKQIQTKNAERMAAANRQFTEIVENGRKALGYIDTLEGKLKQGQQLSADEIERLGAIAGGLDQLRAQYKKPMQEFTELGNYFEREATRRIEKPDAPRFRRLRKLVSKNYREELRSYEKQLDQQRAFAKAHARFSEAYARAQTRIDTIGKDMAAQAQRLYALTSQKQQDYEDFEEFFRKSKQAIEIHLDVIDLDPDVDLPFSRGNE